MSHPHSPPVSIHHKRYAATVVTWLRGKMSSDETITPTVSMPKGLNDAIEERLDYGDTKSGWIREAIRQRLEHEHENDTDAA